MINGIGLSSGSLVGTTTQTGTQGGTSAVSRAGNNAAREDVAQVSTTFSQLSSGGAPIDGGRVDALRAAIKSGTYRADPQVIAGKMISSDLGISL